MHKTLQAIPELLAPAGGVEALHAAVCGGADAVYAGLETLNARRSAQNFTIESFADACDYAHLRGVSVYVTLNTSVLPHELTPALECARQAYLAGADALIIQDIGLVAEVAYSLPEVRIHASTQMNIHNAAGIAALARFRVKRVTLSRELSLSEIAALADVAASFDMEVETFAHGALCVCYSGQCFMSSMVGGRSANRGTCAQACRLPYTLRNQTADKDLSAPGQHLLSPKDLASIEILDDLVQTNVASLKIEGRMKSCDYVFAVTSAYRAVLDRIAHGSDANPTDAERRSLEEVFSRGFTPAFLAGKRGNEIMGYARPNNRGVALGRVTQVAGATALIDTTRSCAQGDIIEVWTKKGRSIHTLTKLVYDRQGRLKLALDERNRDDRAIRAGDRVFRVRSADMTFVDNAFEPRISVSGRAVLRLGQPVELSFSLRDAATGKLCAQGVAIGDAAEAARTKAVTQQDVYTHIDRLGQTPYILEDLAIELDEGVGIGFSQIHHLRTAALDKLSEQVLSSYRKRSLSRVRKRTAAPAVSSSGCKVVAWVTNPSCARVVRRAGADEIIVPALTYKRGEAVMAGRHCEELGSAGYPKGCIIAIPTVEHDPVPGTREARLGFDAWELIRAGKPVFVDSFAALDRALTMDAVPELGPHLLLTNHSALQEVALMGARRAWLSPELSLSQIAELTHAGVPLELGLFVIGAAELMITEHCVLMSQGPCDERCDICPRRTWVHHLRDRKDFNFPVITDRMGRSHIYNSVPLDVSHLVPDILEAGISAIMVDTTLMNSEEAAQAVGRAVRARNLALSSNEHVEKAGGTTSGRLLCGVD